MSYKVKDNPAGAIGSVVSFLKNLKKKLCFCCIGKLMEAKPPSVSLTLFAVKVALGAATAMIS